ncbi:uncharacterized protein LOC129947415 isoform X2 [Eupeodes corollae]|uniref:uncharacterized protein LOC129947415 isoform X2 n=1 Tax=Eupeodes corollae TaxID=290404 RepID=UPI002490F94A|nr:uncharacterized protein LOC129947415 isoform X2 [Eupeodes corollae]
MPKTSKAVSLKQKCDLIAAVRAEKSLYDPRKSHFKPRNGLWSQVAAQCGMKKGLVAKLLWKRIYEAYLDFREDPETNKHKANFELFKRMKFIDQYLVKDKDQPPSPSPITVPVPLPIQTSTDKSTSSVTNSESVQIKEEENEVVVGGDEVQSSNATNINETTTNGEFTTIQYWNDTIEDTNSTNLNQHETNASTVQPQQTPTLNSACSESGSGSGIESYEDILLPDAMNNNGTLDNSLKMFFDAMYASTSQMPQVFQRIVKSKIFAAVLEAEGEAEKHKTSSSISTS